MKRRSNNCRVTRTAGVIPAAAWLVVFSCSAQAEMIDRGGGLIYDADTDKTWLSDTNYASTELTDARVNEIIAAVGSVAGHVLTQDDFLRDSAGNYSGQMSWWGAMAWAEQLVYFDSVRGIVLDDWRLASTLTPDANCTDLNDTPRTDSLGYNCLGSELGHLFYVELGGTASLDPSTLLVNNDPDLDKFSNLQLHFYHTAIEVAPCPNLEGADCNAYFSFYSGFQWATGKQNHNYAWVVRDGDVTPQDSDGDGIDDSVDNCQFVANFDQQDLDNDGAGDGCDNCRLVANFDQRDTDDDGFGNICDGDLDQSGFVDFADLALFREQFFTADSDADFNGDGIVNFFDLSLLRGMFFLAPGPGGFDTVIFENVSLAAGLTRTDNTFGIAWGDLNNDGFPDALLSNHFKEPSLYLNQTDGSFVDVASEHQLNMDPQDPHGASWADYDNDGDQDAVIVSGGGGRGTALLINQSGTLSLHDPNVTGLSYGWSDRMLTWFDENNDGLLDAAIVSTGSKHPEYKSVLFSQDSSHSFEFIFDFGYGGGWAALLTGPLPSPIPDVLLNTGKSFTRQNGTWVENTLETFLPGVQARVGHDYAYGDANNDGILDLLAIRRGNPAEVISYDNVVQADYRALRSELSGFDFVTGGSNLTIYLGLSVDSNDFRLGAGEAPASNLGDFGSVLLDSTSPEVMGEPTIVMSDERVWVWYTPELQKWHLRYGNELQNKNVELYIESDQNVTDLTVVNVPASTSGDPNYLYLGNGTGGLLPDDGQSGLSFVGPSIAGAFGDFDNDMDLDLYLVNGRAADNVTNQYFENDGFGHFVEVDNAANAPGSTLGNGESVSIADYDLDGFLDLFVTNGRSDLRMAYPGPHELYRNLGNANHWIEIDLIGVQSTREAIGAFVELEAGGKTQVRYQDGGIHRFGQHHSRLHFGLAQFEQAEEIRIHWPSGIVQELRDVPADQLLQVHEPVDPGQIGAPTLIPGDPAAVYLWRDSSQSPYHLRIEGDSVPSNFIVTVLSTATLDSVGAFALEATDELVLNTYGFQLQSSILDGSDASDGVDFAVPNGSQLLISVTENGNANPRHLRIGPSKVAAPPAGWIIDAASLGTRPDFTQGEDRGLHLGRSAITGDTVEFRWTGDGRAHAAELNLIFAEPLPGAQAVDLDTGDTIAVGDNRVDVNGFVGLDQDGVDIDMLGNEAIGIAFRMDALLPVRNVFSGAGSLGIPNAYMIDTGTPAPVPATGQFVSFGPGDDGDLQTGIPWPNPRFSDNGDGTVSDELTGLVWLKDASACLGQTNWTDAIAAATGVASSMCGLTDNSQAGDWRLPSAKELVSIVDYGHTQPAIPTGHPFLNVESGFYWTSTSHLNSAVLRAWGVVVTGGNLETRLKSYDAHPNNGVPHYAWPVRNQP